MVLRWWVRGDGDSGVTGVILTSMKVDRVPLTIILVIRAAEVENESNGNDVRET